MPRQIDFLKGGFFDTKSRSRKRAPEAAIGDAVDAYLRSIGAYVRVIKTTGTFQNGKYRPSPMGRGISDRWGVMPGGRTICVELKAPGKKNTLSPDQFHFLSRIIEMGGIACVADCVEDVRLAISQTKAEMLATLEPWREKPPAVSDEPLFP